MEVPGRTSHGPALTRVGPMFYRLWKGEGTDTRMFISSGDHPDGLIDAGSRLWSPPQQVSGQTSHGPALALGPAGLYRLWKNSEDNTMRISTGRPTSSGIDIEWTADRQILGLTSNTPSPLVSFGR
jgi:hypothetical protein